MERHSSYIEVSFIEGIFFLSLDEALNSILEPHQWHHHEKRQAWEARRSMGLELVLNVSPHCRACLRVWLLFPSACLLERGCKCRLLAGWYCGPGAR
jgi:hypothetical protein